MDTVWILLFAAIIITAIFWYFTRGYRSIPLDQVIDLSTEENKLFGSWYEEQLKPCLDPLPSNSELGALLVNRLYGLNVTPETVVLGMDLDLEYHRRTKNKLLPGDRPAETGDSILDLREILGRPGQIALIANPRLQRRLAKGAQYEGEELHKILTQNLEVPVRNYLQEVLALRWGKLSELQNITLRNTSGSYAYLQHRIPNLLTKSEDGFQRVNLLCTDLEFETFLQRWTISLSEEIQML